MEETKDNKIVCKHCENDDQKLIKKLGKTWDDKRRYGCKKCKRTFYG